MKLIIVPVDFSAGSENAAKFAIEFAKKTGAKIVLMHAFESAMLYSKIPLTTMQLDYSFLYNGAAKKLDAFRKKIEKKAGKVEIELNLQQGLPSARVSELALELKADMIVLGSTGKGNIERMMFGSNTIRTIRNAPCMVFVVPPKAAFRDFKRIAYATDFSKDNLEHANDVLPLANLFKSELLFLNVNEDGDLKPKQIKALEDRIHKIVKYKDVKGFLSTDFNTARGVKNSAKNQKVDCIAVYTRHQSLLSRIFGTSIAADLSLLTDIPLLVVHEDDYKDFVKEPASKKRVKA